MTSPSATLAAPPVLPVARADFPTWLPAMLVKELRQGLRTRGFVIAFIVFQVVMVFLMLGTVMGSGIDNASARASMANTINGFFWALLGAQLLLATPARALGSLQVELESRSVDLLVLTRLTAWRIVLGKWGSLVAQAILLFTAMLPYGIVRYFMGSVDLVQDAGRCAALIGGCALLTAAGLAASGMPKAVRILLPIALVILFQMLAALMGRRFFSGGGSIGGTSGLEIALWWFDGLLLLGILLVSAVRRIAPPAENHALLPRALALLSLLPVPLLVAFKENNDARGQAGFAAVLLAVIAAAELSSTRWPMAAHWRTWVARGRTLRWAGIFALPGWQSALAFTVLAGVLVSLCTFVPGLAPAANPRSLVGLSFLAVVALVFPAVALSFFDLARKSPAVLYLLVLAISNVAVTIAYILHNLPVRVEGALTVASVFPGAGFWVLANSPGEVTTAAFVVQCVVGAVILGAAVLQSRAYWRHIAQIDARVEAPKA
ncbi:MAG TPA: hypothetical protein VHO24_10515 [Opitutaceae bacterium]|nr:hypothetical protein [Opitutaceae bacterium]